MILGAFRCRRCSWNQWVTVLEMIDTEEVVGSNPIMLGCFNIKPVLPEECPETVP